MKRSCATLGAQFEELSSIPRKRARLGSAGSPELPALPLPLHYEGYQFALGKVKRRYSFRFLPFSKEKGEQFHQALVEAVLVRGYITCAEVKQTYWYFRGKRAPPAFLLADPALAEYLRYPEDYGRWETEPVDAAISFTGPRQKTLKFVPKIE
jgi:hypothetical protein